MSSALHTRLAPPPTSFYDEVMSPTSSSSSSSCTFFFDAPRLGPCDHQDPVWTKMSTVTAGANKKRKKQEAKPQSQINKCLNEKRRREQENIYIEELAELISASFTEMSSLSVKPDKCAILQETVNQIKTIKQLEVTANSDAVQQGEVSSSKPTIIAQEIFGPLLLEALEGFLFVVSKEGQVEFVTDNVTNFLNYSKDEVLGKSIYNFIHHGDHTRFSHVLMPVSSIGWPPVDKAQKNSNTFTCRLLVKPPDEQETMEEKQQRVSKYENMQISSTQVPFPGDKSGEGSGGGEECGDFGPCLMCVARRIPQNEKHLQLGAPIEQFTIKLEPSGKIIAVDTSGLSGNYSQYINKDLINWNIHDLLHPGDKGKGANYLREMLSGSGSNDSVSPIYRLRVCHTQDKYVHVQTKARFWSGSSEADFVMATHSIISENDVQAAEANSPQCAQSSSSGSVGGPVMPSVNGSVREDMMNTNFTSFSSNNDLNYDFMDFPSSTLELGMMPEERPWERPESRHSTPAPSPHTSFTPAQPSPYQSSMAFDFSPLGDQPPPLDETKDSRKDSTESSSAEGDSARLRNLLLMNKRPSVDSDEGGGGGQKHQVLKTLLNQEEDDPNKNRPPSHASDPPTPTPKVSSGNDMLLKLLNEKSNDDDHESRAGLKKQNELLSQLLKEEENKNQHSHMERQQEDPLLKSLGFSPSPENVGRARKRPSEEGDEPPAKRQPLSAIETLPPVSTSTSNNSKLWEKNKMLASLLAKQPANPTPAQIPPIPASVISGTPQEQLPKIIKQQGWSGGSLQQGGTRPAQQIDGCVVRQRAPPYNQQVYNNNNNNSWDHNQQRTSEQLSDQFLSDILDQVIDIVPDAIATDPASIMDLLDQMGEPPTNNAGQFRQTMSEKMAISEIQKSLMQCESVVKSPAYPNNTQMSQTQQGFPGPPPIYTQRPRFSIQQTQQITIRPGSQQYPIANQQQQLIAQQRNKILQAQQQKQRLLQQQQQQQLLIPINHQPVTSEGLHNIDSLINNTVAPNVSLQRSSSVPDPQLSPSNMVTGGQGGPMLNSTSQISPSQRQPYSPLSHQPFSPVNGGINNFQAGGQSAGQQQQASAQARLSPSGLPTFQQAQLSPRVSQAQQAGGGYTVMSQAGSWPQQQARLTLQQQQNPMLNAQLTGGAYTNNRTFVSQQQQQVQQQRPNQPQQLPPVRSLTSPGARQSPFPADSTHYRLQRTISAPPQATTQLPGGVRHYAASPMKEHHPLLSPSYPPHPHPLPPHQPHQMMYPESSQFCFDQSSLQLYGATTCDRARLPGGAGGNNGMTEYVRQELRAMVGARQQQVRIPGQVSPADFEALGLSFEMANQGGGESPKMTWGNLSSDMSAVSPQSAIQRTGMDEVSRSSDHSKSSLLQKLLSE